ncbi:hypothetical protein CFAM422_009358 [Trichoderma lentiforme]|uniref:Uncharacterized protein n=1 Tax=Trichoderma lentiforme TaxID=1567552 RepID=A0A9P4XA15_9HYPO|nr:hypothetical protein CFAM422_009358 [Trichoderma lentiforme]
MYYCVLCEQLAASSLPGSRQKAEENKGVPSEQRRRRQSAKDSRGGKPAEFESVNFDDKPQNQPA